jgi:hypothetical protein
LGAASTGAAERAAAGAAERAVPLPPPMKAPAITNDSTARTTAAPLARSSVRRRAAISCESRIGIAGATGGRVSSFMTPL